MTQRMQPNNAPFDEKRRDAFEAESTLEAAEGAMRLFSIYLGDRWAITKRWPMDAP
ncbi:MAG: hypothetical protein R2724_03040 [Bryobacterales bacterium]